MTLTESETLMARRIEWFTLGLILLVYLALGTLYAVRTPDWQAPDEPAHYNVIRQIADQGRLPVLQMGDWQQDYQEQIKAAGFDPALLDQLDSIQYEDHQPPLYYLLQAPVFAATDGDLTALRLASVLIGAGAVLCAWAVLRLTLPDHPPLALAGAGFVAFIPQQLSILGSVNNDALAELVAGLLLLAVVVYLYRRPVILSPLVLGLLAGVALITKTTIYFMAGIAVLAVLLRWRRTRWTFRQGAAQVAAVVIPALLIGGVWWARNLSEYGGLDFAGLERHDSVVVGQTRTQDYFDHELGGSLRLYLDNAAHTTFHSFWGQFGWMALPMPGNVYRALALVTLALLIGALLFAWEQHWPRALSAPQRDLLVLFAVMIVLAAAEYALYNLTFVQFQGRYLYAALIPLGFVAAIGLGGWTDPLARRIPLAAWLPVGAVFALAAFAFYALQTYIVPNLPAW